jgi:hypothetical protein
MSSLRTEFFIEVCHLPGHVPGVQMSDPLSPVGTLAPGQHSHEFIGDILGGRFAKATTFDPFDHLSHIAHVRRNNR